MRPVGLALVKSDVTELTAILDAPEGFSGCYGAMADFVESQDRPVRAPGLYLVAQGNQRARR